jgi:hypothetical protein
MWWDTPVVMFVWFAVRIALPLALLMILGYVYEKTMQRRRASVRSAGD